jgi:hypothetical protein
MLEQRRVFVMLRSRGARGHYHVNGNPGIVWEHAKLAPLIIVIPMAVGSQSFCRPASRTKGHMQKRAYQRY